MAAVGQRWPDAAPANVSALPLLVVADDAERHRSRPDGIELPERVVHLADRLTPEVMGFLGPASGVLEETGVEQLLITADAGDAVDPAQAAYGGPTRPLGLPGNVAWLAPAAARGPMSGWRRWQLATAALADALRASRDTAVHAHGFVAALAAGVMLRRQWRGRSPGASQGPERAGRPSIVYYSPHGSASLGRLRWLGVGLQGLARLLIGSQPFDRVITCCAAESRLLPGVRAQHLDRRVPPPPTPWQIHLAESPVARCFHEQPRQPAAEPVVMAGVLEDGLLVAERAARMAVLLSDDELRARVRWVGRVQPDSAALLRAAGIDVAATGNEAALAASMAAAWVFVAPVATTRFPLLLAQAMAAGLPCAALDSPFNAALIKDGYNGFLCRDLEQVLERTRELIQYPAVRERIGRNARREAARRFDERLFRQALLLGYGVRRGEPSARRAAPQAGGVAP